MPPPDRATLSRWRREWEARRAAAYRELVASYTPEQRATIARMGEAARQARLCRDRYFWPDGRSGSRGGVVAWPDEPPHRNKPK